MDSSFVRRALDLTKVFFNRRLMRESNHFFTRDFGPELRYFWCQEHIFLLGKDWIPVLKNVLGQVNALQEYLFYTEFSLRESPLFRAATKGAYFRDFFS